MGHVTRVLPAVKAQWAFLSVYLLKAVGIFGASEVLSDKDHLSRKVRWCWGWAVLLSGGSQPLRCRYSCRKPPWQQEKHPYFSANKLLRRNVNYKAEENRVMGFSEIIYSCTLCVMWSSHMEVRERPSGVGAFPPPWNLGICLSCLRLKASVGMGIQNEWPFSRNWSRVYRHHLQC